MKAKITIVVETEFDYDNLSFNHKNELIVDRVSKVSELSGFNIKEVWWEEIKDENICDW